MWNNFLKYWQPCKQFQSVTLLTNLPPRPTAVYFIRASFRINETVYIKNNNANNPLQINNFPRFFRLLILLLNKLKYLSFNCWLPDRNIGKAVQPTSSCVFRNDYDEQRTTRLKQNQAGASDYAFRCRRHLGEDGCLSHKRTTLKFLLRSFRLPSIVYFFPFFYALEDGQINAILLIQRWPHSMSWPIYLNVILKQNLEMFSFALRKLEQSLERLFEGFVSFALSMTMKSKKVAAMRYTATVGQCLRPWTSWYSTLTVYGVIENKVTYIHIYIHNFIYT